MIDCVEDVLQSSGVVLQQLHDLEVDITQQWRGRKRMKAD